MKSFSLRIFFESFSCQKKNLRFKFIWRVLCFFVIRALNKCKNNLDNYLISMLVLVELILLIIFYKIIKVAQDNYYVCFNKNLIKNDLVNIFLIEFATYINLSKLDYQNIYGMIYQKLAYIHLLLK